MFTLATVALLAGCSASGTTVGIVGDSLTATSAPAIEAALQPRYDTTIVATVGNRIDQELPAMRAMLDGGTAPPRDVIVNLGTNDATGHRVHPDWQTGFREEIDLLSHVRCVILVTVNTNADIGASSTTALDINAAMKATAAARPNFHILDWDGIVHRAGNSAWLANDSIHLTDQGKAALAQLYASSLDKDC